MAPVVSSSMYNNLDISSVPFTMTWQRADTCTDGPVMLIQIRAARSNPTVGLRRLREGDEDHGQWRSKSHVHGSGIGY
jgi:hypothetical protein